MVLHIKASLNERGQICTAPAHHSIDHPVRPGRHDFLERGPLLCCQFGLGTCGLPIDQPLWALFIEPMHPVSERLTIHQTYGGGFRSAQTICNARQRHQPSRLLCVA